MTNTLSKMNINELPRDCFMMFLIYFSLQQLIKLRLVCKKWRSVIMEMCSKRKSLKLFSSMPSVVNYLQMLFEYGLHDNEHYRPLRLFINGKDDDLIGGVDGPKTSCHFLTDLFPNVSLLVIDYRNLAHLDVPFLIARFAKLSSLAIRYVECPPKPVFNAINSNRNLKFLGLLQKKSKGKRASNVSRRIQLSALSQLEQFVFAGFEGDAVQVLRQLGPNIKRLVLCEMDVTIAQWKQLFTAKPSLRKTVTHLTVYDTEQSDADQYEMELLKLICANLSSLTFLDLVHFDVPIDYLIAQLAKLNKLADVRLYLDEDFYSSIYETLDGIKHLPKLPSVKNLDLQPLGDSNFFKAGHFYPLFSHLMPNLESFTLHISNVQTAEHVSRRALDEFAHIRQFTHISPGRYDRGFVGRHSLAYMRYLERVKPRVNHAEEKMYREMKRQMADDNCVLS